MKLATRLEAGGFTFDQARAVAVAGALGDAAQVADLATNADLRSAVDLLEQWLTVRMGGMLVVLAGILLTAIKYMH